MIDINFKLCWTIKGIWKEKDPGMAFNAKVASYLITIKQTMFLLSTLEIQYSIRFQANRQL